MSPYKSLKPLALIASLLAGSALAEDTSPAPKRILDVELKMLDKLAAKAPQLAPLKSELAAELVKFDGQRKALLTDLAADLKALEAAAGAAVEPLLEKLDDQRKALRSMRQAKHEALGAHFTDSQKLKLLLKMGERHSARRGRGHKLAGFVRRHAGSFLTKILGVSQGTADAVMAQVEAHRESHEVMRAEFQQFAAEVKAEGPGADEETARLLIAKARALRTKAHASQDAALAAARQALTVEQRAELITKVTAGVRTVAGWATAFWPIDELKLLL